MKFFVTTDSSFKSSVEELSDELIPIIKKIESKYKNVKLGFNIIFRCLPDEYNRKTFRRFSKKDNKLYLDITVSEDEYEKMSKDEQRIELGNTFYTYLVDSLHKYKFKEFNVELFLKEIKNWLIKIRWLTNESIIKKE